MRRTKINLNGDTAGKLLAELQAAHTAVMAAKDAIDRLTIHQRNYQNYVSPMENWRADAYDRMTYSRTLADCTTWLSDSYTAIDAQVPQTGE